MFGIVSSDKGSPRRPFFLLLLLFFFCFFVFVLSSICLSQVFVCMSVCVAGGFAVFHWTTGVPFGLQDEVVCLIGCKSVYLS